LTINITCRDAGCTPTLTGGTIYDKVIDSSVPLSTAKSKLKINIGSYGTTACYIDSTCKTSTNTNLEYKIWVSPLGSYNYVTTSTVKPNIGSGYTSASFTFNPQCDWVLSN
jgi:hypothetical protein